MTSILGRDNKTRMISKKEERRKQKIAKRQATMRKR